MKRSTSNAIRVSILVVLAILTGGKEHHSRYHLDTWQQDDFVTIRTLGIPVWRSKVRSGYLRYRDAYVQITGREPDPDRWLVRRPDYVASLLMSSYRCGSMGFELNERRKLISAVFDRFKEGIPRETAASLLKRIDDAVPAPSGKGVSFDPVVVDAIRLEVGLEPRFKEATPEATTSPAAEKEKQAS